MSATLEGDLFARYFVDHIKHKKITPIFVGVKRFPVEFVRFFGASFFFSTFSQLSLLQIAAKI